MSVLTFAYRISDNLPRKQELGVLYTYGTFNVQFRTNEVDVMSF